MIILILIVVIIVILIQITYKIDYIYELEDGCKI